MKHYYYVGLTIGPIYRTLEYARKTRELWAASFLFSFIMKNIIDKITYNNTLEDSEYKYDVILPTKLNSAAYGSLKEVGLFPDRLIVRVESSVKQDPKIIHKNFLKIIEDANKKVKEKCNINDLDFFKECIHQYSLAIELDKKDNPLESIFPLLESMDCQSSFKPEFEVNNIRKYIESVKSTPLYKEIFGKEHRFRSIQEIATFELSEIDGYGELFSQYDTQAENYNLYKELKDKLKNSENIPELKNYHKYMAVVQADGDDLGRLFKAIFKYGGIEAIQMLSGVLMKFGAKAASGIKSYGGVPIYLGGDDILFFAPLKTSNDNGAKNIFELITSIDNIYAESLSECNLLFESIHWWNKNAQSNTTIKPIATPTLSFGCAISYHKYPLKEALIAARTLLFENAKQVSSKNALSYRLLKHSGHFIGTTLCKNWESWDAFKYLLSNEPLNNEFLASIQYKLEPLRPLLKRILCGRDKKSSNNTLNDILLEIMPNENQREVFLINLSAKFFNKTGAHDKSRKYIEYVLSLLLQIYRDMEDNYGNNKITADMAIDSLYAYLKTMQFYNQPLSDD